MKFASPKSVSRLLWLAIVPLALGVFLLMAPRGFVLQLLQTVASMGAWAPVVFILAYVAAAVFLVPGGLMTMGAGVMFGLVYGMVFTYLGATLGAAVAFGLGRHCGREWVLSKLGRHPKWEALDAAIAAEGWKIVLLARLSPWLPFVVLNYLFSLSSVSFRHFLVATVIGKFPTTLMYVWLGVLAGDLSNLHGVRPERTVWEWLFYVGGAVATVVLTWMIARRCNQTLTRKLEPSQ
jgi:uncharacterized membrane protein YdjX (TVP38/TMEM64 family)